MDAPIIDSFVTLGTLNVSNNIKKGHSGERGLNCYLFKARDSRFGPAAGADPKKICKRRGTSGIWSSLAIRSCAVSDKIGWPWRGCRKISYRTSDGSDCGWYPRKASRRPYRGRS